MATSVHQAGVTRIDTEHAVQLAERVWWVGHYIPGDPFQCHVYLIEQGNQSVLIDPGSLLTFHRTLEKVQEIVPFSHIRYFICHHQDPDITASMTVIDGMLARDDAVLVTHTRARALLKHYGLRIPFWCVDDNHWKLALADRVLEFVFTPYLHFPGAFCSFDAASGILFSSDLFGGFTEEWSLYATGKEYFEAIRPFHEHYMPSREILLHGMLNIEQYPVQMIAPQHGSIITTPLVGYFINKLKELDCGLYLVTKHTSDVLRLSRINRMLRDIIESMTMYRDFRDVSVRLLELARRLMPVETLEFYVAGGGHKTLRFAPDNRYHGEEVTAPPFCEPVFALTRQAWRREERHTYRQVTVPALGTQADAAPLRRLLLIPLFASEGENAHAIALLQLSADAEISPEMDEILGQLSVPLAIATEREAIQRMLEIERNKLYERSIRDPLTGLYTRIYMGDTVQRLLDLHDRDASRGIALVMFDIDHFKQINDVYGHIAGDEVLNAVGRVLLHETRAADVPVRFGGEEFAVFIAARTVYDAQTFAERVRAAVEKLSFEGTNGRFSVTISAGIACRNRGEPLLTMLNRADKQLYCAKECGRNRICVELLPSCP